MNFIKNQVKEFKQSGEIDKILFPKKIQRVYMWLFMLSGVSVFIIGAVTFQAGNTLQGYPIMLVGLFLMLVFGIYLADKAYRFIYNNHIKKQE